MLRRIGFDADNRVADGELINRRSKVTRRHVEQHAPCLSGRAPHRPRIALHGRRTTRSPLIDGNVRAAHNAGGLKKRNVEFIGHQLPETRSGALPGVGFANVKGRSVVFVNDNPRIELVEVGIGIKICWVGVLLFWAATSTTNALPPVAKPMNSRPALLRKPLRCVLRISSTWFGIPLWWSYPHLLFRRRSSLGGRLGRAFDGRLNPVIAHAAA